MKITKAVLDLETTGLDPKKDVILEVGVILVDENYTEVKRHHNVVFQNHYDLERMDDYVKNMHTKSGLLKEVVSRGVVNIEAQAQLVAFITEHCEVGKVQLVGNSIGFDKSFLTAHMSQAASLFHYRVVDLRSIQTFLEDLGERFSTQEMPHRSLPDCELALARAMEMRNVYKTLKGNV